LSCLFRKGGSIEKVSHFSDSMGGGCAKAFELDKKKTKWEKGKSPLISQDKWWRERFWELKNYLREVLVEIDHLKKEGKIETYNSTPSIGRRYGKMGN